MIMPDMDALSRQNVHGDCRPNAQNNEQAWNRAGPRESMLPYTTILLSLWLTFGAKKV
jgi:hypothetical protein